ncbi:MAG: response regulator transcription factor [Limnochordales bacterium]|jgi:Response regulator containing a CheY-like receiver domain and an HTH DNA-binding domain|nr:hypothetical protein [Bacillota bacterium]
MRDLVERFQQLSAREREVLVLIAQGLTNDEIARALFISPHTVKNHVSRIYQKLGMDDRTKVAIWAVRLGIVPLESAGEEGGTREGPAAADGERSEVREPG